jgi:hypothetical protein
MNISREISKLRIELEVFIAPAPVGVDKNLVFTRKLETKSDVFSKFPSLTRLLIASVVRVLRKTKQGCGDCLSRPTGPLLTSVALLALLTHAKREGHRVEFF